MHRIFPSINNLVHKYQYIVVAKYIKSKCKFIFTTEDNSRENKREEELHTVEKSALRKVLLDDRSKFQMIIRFTMERLLTEVLICVIHQ